MRCSHLLLTTCLCLVPVRAQADEGFRDVELTVRVRQAIQKDPSLRELDISVHVKKGEVTLDGSVLSAETAELAGKLANGVTGTLKVTNHIKTGVFPDFEEWLPPSLFGVEEKEPKTAPEPVASIDVVPKPRTVPKLDEKPDPKPPQTAVKVEPERTEWSNPVRTPKKPVVKQTSAKQDPKPMLAVRRNPAPDPVQESSLREKLRDVLDSYWRYQGLRLYASDGVVSIRGRAMSGQDLNELALEVSRVPGVKRVRIEDVDIGR